MSTRKDALMESLISHLEVRGELCPEGNAATERAIAAIEKELHEEVENNRFTLWKTGYSFQTALAVIKISETEKAIKFKVPDSKKEYEFFLPKSAVRVDKNSSGILILANWFTVAGFLAFLFDRYGSVYKR